jgi:hypothetical protein
MRTTPSRRLRDEGRAGWIGLPVDRLKDAFQTYWTNAHDLLMQQQAVVGHHARRGVTLGRGTDDATIGAFTYSTRMANTHESDMVLVGEVFGAEGAAETTPEYKVGPAGDKPARRPGAHRPGVQR